VSQEQKPRRKEKRKSILIRALIVLVLVLLCVVLWLAGRAGMISRLGQGIVQLPGLQLLLTQLDLGLPGLPSRGQQWLQEGAALEREGKPGEALQLYRQAQEAMPDAVEPHLALASAHEALGEGEEALEHLKTAVELDPKHARAQRELGRLLCLGGEVDACTETLLTAIALDPDDPQGHYWLGLAYQQGAEGRFADAEKAYLRALSLEPDSPRAHLALGGLYQSQPGMEALALEQIEEALRLAVAAGETETATKARAELARYYYAQDNYDLCVENGQQVLEQDPDDADTLRRLGLCLAMRRNPGDLEQSIAALEQALALDFGTMDAYYFYLGQFYASQEDYSRAFFAWDQFLRFSSDEDLRADVRAWMKAYQDAIQEGQAP
jgi:tetratricopeptide (TPR) repeat protein